MAKRGGQCDPKNTRLVWSLSLSLFLGTARFLAKINRRRSKRERKTARSEGRQGRRNSSVLLLPAGAVPSPFPATDPGSSVRKSSGVGRCRVRSDPVDKPVRGMGTGLRAAMVRVYARASLQVQHLKNPVAPERPDGRENEPLLGQQRGHEYRQKRHYTFSPATPAYARARAHWIDSPPLPLLISSGPHSLPIYVRNTRVSPRVCRKYTYVKGS